MKENFEKPQKISVISQIPKSIKIEGAALEQMKKLSGSEYSYNRLNGENLVFYKKTGEVVIINKKTGDSKEMGSERGATFNVFGTER